MPIHDWTRVDAGLFHNFHQHWTVALCDALNAGTLPSDYFALVEQRLPGPIPDVLTLKLSAESREPRNGGVGLAVATAPPRVSLVQRNEAAAYAARANRLTIRHRHGEVIAVVEIVSPGNKSNQHEFRAFIAKALEFLRHNIHLLIIDLFPAGPRDPEGIHKALWSHLDEGLERPAGKPLTAASYDAGPAQVGYVEFLAVGDPLPEMPLFLEPGFYVPAPLEATYQQAWAGFPAPLKGLLEEPK